MHCGPYNLDSAVPTVMGVVNVTPDSFSDGGKWLDPPRAVDHALQLFEQGADIVDIGGESTRPGAADVSVEEEMRRVIPVVSALAKQIQRPISVDTSRPEVMRAAIDAGAAFVNDVRALQVPGALATVAPTAVGICLMHMQGEPRTMQAAPQYQDPVDEVRRFLAARVVACEAAGIARARLCIDPGIGFGKTLEHNVSLIAHTAELSTLGLPVLVGVSRKSFIGALTGRPVDERLAGGLAAATAAVLAGASIIRTHDVAPTVDAVKVAAALRDARRKAAPNRQ